jgi:hypothetical protein
MIGQHPQTCALPELQLFGAATMSEWWGHSSQESFPMADGLLRAVAQLCYGGQSEEAVVSARGWLNRRQHSTPGFVIEELIDSAFPKVVVEKSPGVVYRLEYMRRIYSWFPTARFIHLVRHPIGHGQAVLDAIEHLSRFEALPPTHWLFDLASARWPFDLDAPAEALQPWDPQGAWLALNQNIRTFLASVPAERKLVLRGEDLVRRPDATLRRVAEWRGLSTNPQAIEAMKQPRRSVFAGHGPASARYGIDVFLSSRPYTLSERPIDLRLDAPLPWPGDGRGLRPEVKQLARELGYE